MTSQGKYQMSAKKIEPEARTVNHSLRLTEADTERVRVVAKAHDWPMGKVLVVALDARLLK